MDRSTFPGKQFSLIFVLALVINGLILGYFHNRFWWPPDEGAYAHTAERILNGEALNSDVEEIHAGYLNFIHTGAFAIFGVRLVSLRYPLIAIAFLQSIVLFLVFGKRNLLVAFVVSISAISLGVTQYLNPQPSWYCLFLVTMIAYCLTNCPKKQKFRLELIGFLGVLIFLLRQITGVFVLMGVLTYLLGERTAVKKPSKSWLARALLIVMFLGLIFYLQTSTDSYGFLLFGIWPVALLGHAIIFSNTSNGKSFYIVMRLALGGLVAALPMFIYHVVHLSLRTFYDDVVIRALAVSKFSYLKVASYYAVQSYAFHNVLGFASITAVINGLYWLILPLIALITGTSTVLSFRKSRATNAVGALPILAIFYSLVALLQQIPIYLYYTIPLSLAGLFWLNLKRRKEVLVLCVVATCFSAIGLYFHAAQPLSRLLGGTVRGDRISLVPSTTLDRCGLWIDAESLGTYTELVKEIRNGSQPDETIFVLPNNPELYFLAERRNAFRFWNSGIGIQNDKERDEVLNVLRTRAPRMIVIATKDRNNTARSDEIINYVRASYRFLNSVADFEIYRTP